jgi:hypothetical protein
VAALNRGPANELDKAELNEWQRLSEPEQEAMLAEAEAALRAQNAAFRNMRRLPTPLVTAHARHLLATKSGQGGVN